jgi:hypothetical protein
MSTGHLRLSVRVLKRKHEKTTYTNADRSFMAGVAGLEPTTPGFGDQCSTN